MNCNSTTTIEQTSTNALDIHGARVTTSPRVDDGSGLAHVNESLKHSVAEVMYNSARNNTENVPNKQTFSTPNKQPETPRLTEGYVHPNDLKIGIDQATLVFVTPYYRHLLNLTEKYFKGDVEEAEKTGFYKRRFVAKESGYSILTNHISDHNKSQVYIPASTMNTLPVDRRVELLNDALNMGGDATRLDIYADYIHPETDIVEQAITHADCPRNTRLKVSKFQQSKDGFNTGKTLYLGSRTSRRYWRLYDKGLEQETTGNIWQRVEVELKKEFATQAMIQICADDNYLETMRALVFQDEAWVNQPDFWKRAAEGKLDIVLGGSTTDITLSRFRDWINRNLQPKVQMLAEATGQSRTAVYALLTANFDLDKTAESRRHSELIAQFEKIRP